MKKITLSLVLMLIYISSNSYAQCKLIDPSSNNLYELILDEDFLYEDLNHMKNNNNYNWRFFYNWNPSRDLDPTNPSRTIFGNCDQSQYYDESQISFVSDGTNNTGLIKLTLQNNSTNPKYVRVYKGEVNSNTWNKIPFCYCTDNNLPYADGLKYYTKHYDGALGEDYFAKELLFTSGMLSVDLSNLPNSSMTNNYGIYQIRAKLPRNKEGLFPAFWLLNAGSEIDIIDNGGDIDSKTYTNFIDHNSGKYHSTIGLKYGNLLSDQFNTYSLVHTPTKSTFFLNEREVFTIENSYLLSQNIDLNSNPFNLLLTFQVRYWAAQPWNNIQTEDLLIDYVKVYKLIDQNECEYKSQMEYVSSNLSSYPIIPNDPEFYSTIKSSVNNIASMDNNRILATSENNRLYEYVKNQNDKIILTRLLFNSPTTCINNDLVFNDLTSKYYYKDFENRIVECEFSINTNDYNFRYIDNGINIEMLKGNIKSGSITILSNGCIRYIDMNNNLIEAQLDLNSNLYNFKFLNLNSIFSSNLVSKGNNSYFISNDNNVYEVSYLGSHFLTFNNTQILGINSKLGSICKSQDGLFFINSDETLSEMVLINGEWQENVINHDYNPPWLGYANAHHPKGNLVFDELNNMVIYTGRSGEIMAFYKSNGNWEHKYINDYWNTNQLLSFNSNEPNKNSSTYVNNGQIYYTNFLSKLYLLKYKLCENLNVSYTDINKPINAPNNVKSKLQKAESEKIDEAIIQIENPTDNLLSFENDLFKSKRFNIYDSKGIKIVDQIYWEPIKLNLPCGIYFISILSDNAIISSRKIIIRN